MWALSSLVYRCLNIILLVLFFILTVIYERVAFLLWFSIDTEVEKGRVLSKSQIAMTVVGSFIFCFLVGASITVGLILWVQNVKRNKSRKRITRLSKGRLSINYNEVSLLSPGAVKFEFPRSNLELQDILGELIPSTTAHCMHIGLCLDLVQLLYLRTCRWRTFWKGVQR